MATPQENDAFRASFERTYKYAMESPPLSSVVVFAYRLNALALVGFIWYACGVVVGVSTGPPAAWTRWLSIAAVGGAVAVGPRSSGTCNMHTPRRRSRSRSSR